MAKPGLIGPQTNAGSHILATDGCDGKRRKEGQPAVVG